MNNSKSGSGDMVEKMVDTVDIRSSAGQAQETRQVQIVHQLHPPAAGETNSGAGGVLANAAASIASAIQSAKDAVSALKLDHARVIDTSYIFKDANGPTRKKPSLSLLCKAELGYDLQKPGNPHNRLDDACAAMKLVLARLEGRIDDVISEEVTELDAGKKELDAGRLFVHRIPVNVRGKDLQEVIPGDFTLQMKNTCSAFALFKRMEEANEAFENLEGDLEKVYQAVSMFVKLAMRDRMETRTL